MRFMVTTCTGSKRFSSMRGAVKYARGQSARPTKRCPRVNVWRMQPEPRRAGYEHGEIVAICTNKVCKPTGWLQRGRNPL
jgi:hypothetical protein